jgi:hypothetical protein
MLRGVVNCAYGRQKESEQKAANDVKENHPSQVEAEEEAQFKENVFQK